MKRRASLPRTTQKRSTRTVERVLVLVALLLATVLVAAAAYSVRVATDSLQAGREVVQSYQLISGLNDLLIGLAETDASERGYLLSGKPALLQPYHEARFRVMLQMKALRPLTHDRPTAAASVAELEPLVAARLESMAKAVDQREQHGADAARHAGDVPFLGAADPLNQLVARAQQYEEQHLKASIVRQEDAATRELMLLIGTFSALTLLAIIFWAVLRSEFAQRRELEAQLVDSAVLDELTGALNRREFERLLHQEWAFRMRYGTPLSLLLINIDHIERVTDQWGHTGRDIILRELVRRLNMRLRSTERLARYAGEEFALLLPQPLTAASELARQLCLYVAQEPFFYPNQDPPRSMELSISVGIAEASDVETPQELITASDDALFAAKSGGRGRAESYQASMRRGFSTPAPRLKIREL